MLTYADVCWRFFQLTSQMSVDGDSDEVTKKREEVAAKLMVSAPSSVVDQLDAAREYGRCQHMYDYVVSNVETLLNKCDTATQYLERLRKSLPISAVTMQLDVKEQDTLWAWCDLEVQKYLRTGTKVLAYWYKSTCLLVQKYLFYGTHVSRLTRRQCPRSISKTDAALVSAMHAGPLTSTSSEALHFML